MKRTYPLMAVLAVVMGTAIALATGAHAAVQVASPPNHVIAIEPVATLDVKGVVVIATVDIICTQGLSANGSISVNQTSHGSIATGSGYVEVTRCTGQPQAAKITVTAYNRPFHRNTAFAQATLSYCGPTSCRSGVDERTIRIR